jgi:hypothetical protein
MEARFWKKVNKTENCWIWTGGGMGGWGEHKYGCIGNGRRGTGSTFAHRFSWTIHYGTIPDGMDVLHKCDNTLCVNPEHLFLGTQKDNSKDMVKKGRRRGGKKPLEQSLIDKINELYDSGMSEIKISKLFHISRNHAHKYYKNANAWIKQDGTPFK